MRFLLPALVLLSSACAAQNSFTLKPDFKGPCAKAAVVDVNLGHTPETFIQACACQVFGKMPDAALVQAWAAKLRSDGRLRRIDVVRTFLRQAGRPDKLAYSNPWANDPELPPAPPTQQSRKIGTIMMFFFHCPGGVNCGMDWANNHVNGMQGPYPGLAWGGKPGAYTAANPGFWTRELRDARAAGLDFVLPNVYGPDMGDGWVKTLAQSLAKEDPGVKIGLMDDTWAWGQKYFGDFWAQAPSFAVPGLAAQKLYTSKWKPFFSTIDRKHWQLVDGKPVIYFYNAGRILPLDRSSETLSRMKAMFKKDFGVEPWVAMDNAFFADKRLNLVADGRFIWAPLQHGVSPDRLSHFSLKGKRLTHAITRWDAVGREHPGALPKPDELLLKGPELLQTALDNSKDSALLVLGTWNDLGEGTGLNRAYDYWYKGQWLQPDHFMRMIRDSRAR